MLILEENKEGINELNSDGKRFKRAKPNPPMPPTTPITEGTIDSKVWLEVTDKLATKKTLKSSRKNPD